MLLKLKILQQSVLDSCFNKTLVHNSQNVFFLNGWFMKILLSFSVWVHYMSVDPYERIHLLFYNIYFSPSWVSSHPPYWISLVSEPVIDHWTVPQVADYNI